MKCVNYRSLINSVVSAILPSGPEPRHLVVSGVNVKCFCCRRMVSEERWTSGEHRRQCAINKSVQGDTSGCFLGFVDKITKAVFQYMFLVLKHNFYLNVNNT